MSNCKLTDDHIAQIKAVSDGVVRGLAEAIAEFTTENRGSTGAVRELAAKELVPTFYAAFDAACDVVPGARG